MQLYLATPDDQAQVAFFLEENQVSLPTLLDPRRDLLDAYNLSEASRPTAPYPIHVVIDAQGVVRYLSTESDLVGVREAIEALLAEG